MCNFMTFCTHDWFDKISLFLSEDIVSSSPVISFDIFQSERVVFINQHRIRILFNILVIFFVN